MRPANAFATLAFVVILGIGLALTYASADGLAARPVTKP